MRLIALLLVLAVFLRLWRRDTGWSLVATPFLFLAYWELARILPAFLLSDRLGLTDGLLPLLAAIVAYAAVMVGFAAVWPRNQGPGGGDDSLRFARTRQACLPAVPRESEAVLALSLLLAGFGLLWFGGLPPVVDALIQFAGGGGDEIAAGVSRQRFELTKGAYFGGAYIGQGLMRTVMRVGWTLILSYAGLRWIERRTFGRLAAVLAALVAAWVFVAGDGTRGPFLEVILIAVAICSLRQRLGYRAAAALFAAGLTLAIGLGLYSGKMYFAMQSSEGGFVGTAVSRILSRVFLANGINDIHIIDRVISGELPLRWGATHVGAYLNALPGVQANVPLSHELFEILNPESNRTTYLSGTYISTVFIDFGWYGLVPLFAAAGMVAGWAQRFLFARDASAWTLALKSVFALQAASIVYFGFHGFIARTIVLGAIAAAYYLLLMILFPPAPVLAQRGNQVGVSFGEVPR